MSYLGFQWHPLAIFRLSLAIVFSWSAFHPKSALASDAELLSPDGSICVVINDGESLNYQVFVDGKSVLAPSPLGLTIGQSSHLGKDCTIKEIERTSADTTWLNRFGKCRTVRNHYQALKLRINSHDGGTPDFDLVLRAYDDGISFSYGIREAADGNPIVITENKTGFLFTSDNKAWFGARPSFESNFPESRLSELPPGKKSLPLVARSPAAFVAVAEADVRDWSRSHLVPKAGKTPGVTCALIAPVKLSSSRQSPWHVVMIGRSAGDLIESNLLENLASPSRIADETWIKPGCMAWDPWWTGENAHWDKFKGLGARGNTQSGIDYIDLAASMGWPYMLIDWYWYDKKSKDPETAIKAEPHIDMPALFTYAKQKGIKLFLWVHSDNIPSIGAERLFATYAKWGAVGVKIDFFKKNGSQATMRWQEELLERAAKHRLMVNFHGTYTPTGLSRTWPNLVGQEAVLGLEYNKMGDLCDPKHMVTLPFTRGLLGPADTTPGGFVHSTVEEFRKNSVPCQVMGTRARHLAFSTMMTSPVLCLCDSPKNYQGQAGIEFFRDLPTVWDETKVLSSDMATHLVEARRSGKRWYVSAINADSPLQLQIPLNFLEEGSYKVRIFEDTPESTTRPATIRERQIEVSASDELSIQMVGAGGFAAVLKPQ